jgi:RP/EB family microtubule-associated protein
MDGTYFVSRVECLAWLNRELAASPGYAGGEVTKVEQCGSASAYLTLCKRIFPKHATIAARGKDKAATEYDRLHNWKLLQDVLYKAGLTRIIEIEKLAKGTLQINLEFLQWFKRIFEARRAAGGPGAANTSPGAAATSAPSPPLGHSALPADSAAPGMDPVDLERRYYFDKLLQIERLVTSAELLMPHGMDASVGSRGGSQNAVGGGVQGDDSPVPSSTNASAVTAEELAARIRHVLYKP